jgi:hypothetical protein
MAIKAKCERVSVRMTRKERKFLADLSRDTQLPESDVLRRCLIGYGEKLRRRMSV